MAFQMADSGCADVVKAVFSFEEIVCPGSSQDPNVEFGADLVDLKSPASCSLDR
jgi:hypothetical protein